MSAFDRFMTNQAIIHRQDGTEQEIMCNIQRSGITIQDVSIRVEEGDEISTINPAGVQEVYLVEHVIYHAPKNFSKDMHHISIEYSKRGSLQKEKNTNQYTLNNSSLAIDSPNTIQKSGLVIDLSDIEISDSKIKSTVKILQEELGKTNRDRKKIKTLLENLISKAPEIIINILLKIFLNE